MIRNFENSRGHLEAYVAIVSNDHTRQILGVLTMPIVINVNIASRNNGCNNIHLMYGPEGNS